MNAEADEHYAPAALDIVSMLMQVSRGYLMAELPVSEAVMQQLAEKFGFLMQIFARLVEQQCGEMPSLEGRARRKVRLESDPSAEGSAVGAGGFARARQMAKLAQETAAATAANLKHAMDEEDEEGGGGGGGDEPAIEEGTSSVQALCVRLSSVHYIIGSCDELLKQIIQGAVSQNYTGAPLDKAMDEVKNKLRGAPLPPPRYRTHFPIACECCSAASGAGGCLGLAQPNTPCIYFFLWCRWGGMKWAGGRAGGL